MPRLGPEGSRDIVRRPSPSSTGGIAFGPYQLDVCGERLFRKGTRLDMTPRQFAMLHMLVANAGQVISKDVLAARVWGDVAVSDNSVERMMSDIRTLLDADDREAYLRTVPRRGYTCDVLTSPCEIESDFDIETLLSPYRACIEGRAALETLTHKELIHGLAIFESLAAQFPDRSTFHVGIAIASVLLYESTRTDATPDYESLQRAVRHSHKACELNPRSAEASATLGVVLERTGDRAGAISALYRACSLESDNWLHRCRLASVTWGKERVTAARRTLQLCPGFPMAHWLAASVPIAQGSLADAEREIDAAIASFRAESGDTTAYLSVALFYVKGLLCFARGAIAEALAAWDEELALESRGHFYARECCANVWYSKGACFIFLNDLVAARAAFMQALARVPEHPLAKAGLAILDGTGNTGQVGQVGAIGAVGSASFVPPVPSGLLLDPDMARAVLLAHAGDVSGAVRLLADALRAAPPGNAGWLITLDPLLRVWENRTLWEPVLTQIKRRAR